MLLIVEAGLLSLLGVLAGTALSYLLLIAAQPLIMNHFGIFVRIAVLRPEELMILAGIVGAAVLMGLIPAWRAYRNSLADGLTIRV